MQRAQPGEVVTSSVSSLPSDFSITSPLCGACLLAQPSAELVLVLSGAGVDTLTAESCALPNQREGHTALDRSPAGAEAPSCGVS